MKKHWVKGLIGALVLIAVAGLFMNDQEEERVDLVVRPTTGPFQVTVTVTGELQAKNSVKIMGPPNARQQRIAEMKILRLVPEGTVVQKGDFVAELDRSELSSRIKDEELELQVAMSEYEQMMLDTLMTLSQARDEQVNQQYAMEEARLRKEQARYEAPSIQRQAEIDFEKAERAYQQSVANYQTLIQQSEAQMREVEAELSQNKNQLAELMNLAQQFVIMAPENGMVVYRRNWRGERITQGSSVSAWDPVVAELPDLTVMESVTYINEVDIQKIQPGQSVEIGLDADPDKKLSGTVTRVANIGEQRPDSDAKVFEVVVQVNRTDSTLRPAMTTSNTILIAELPEALQIPLETIHTADSLNFVYLKHGAGAVRQEVQLGLLNENSAVVLAGLSDDDQVFLSLPADTTGLAFRRLEGEAVQEGGVEEALAAGNTRPDGERVE